MATSKFIFDTTLQDYVPNPALDTGEPKVSVYDGIQDVVEGSEDPVDDRPGGSATDAVFPPDTFSVIEQITRNNPDGSTSVDIIIEVEDDGTGRQYEVRISR